MIYRFIDKQGTFRVKDPQKYNLYFPLTNRDGSLLSSISPNLAGDIKSDNRHFLTPPASVEDLRSNLLCRREFFIKTKNKTFRLSLPWEETLESGFLYHRLVKKTSSLQAEVLNFIPYDSALEVMHIKIKNISNQEIEFTPTSFLALYGRSEKCLRDHRHVTSLLNRVYLNKFGILLKPTMVFDEQGHTANKAIYYVLGFEDEGIPPLGQFPSLDYFYGQGDILNPQAIEAEIKPVTKNSPEFNGKEACAAFRFRNKVLKKNAQANYYILMGISASQTDIKSSFARLNSPFKIEKSLLKTKQYWQNYLGVLDFDFGNRDYNNWLLWVKLQPTLRKLFGCSFLPHFDYGKGGRGWRDLWQDALTLLLTEPDKSRDFLIKNFRGARIDGSNATIITKDGEFLSDRNRISRVWMDHGIWPYLTLRLYLNRTGDMDILLENDVYFQDHQFKRAKEIDRSFSHQSYILKDKNNNIYSGTILEHILVQNLVQFFNVGRHNIIRLENADWNDGLDMAPDHGESVTFSFMYAHNLKDICNYLKRLKEKTQAVSLLGELFHLLEAKNNSSRYADYQYKHKRLDQYLESVKTPGGGKKDIRIEDLIFDLETKASHLFHWLGRKEWLKEGFFNGYYDNKGRRVEGRTPHRKMRMLLASQVFAIMSETASDKQVKKTWLSIKRYLQDKKLGGFRLNTNFNSHHHLDLGRAFGFSYGDKENGAFFSHMSVMLANALYSRGFIKEGFEVIQSIYKMAISDKARIYPLIPEYFNSQGRGLYFYLTGSASWYVYTLLEKVLGINFVFGDISLEPKLIRENFFTRDIQVNFSLRSIRVKVMFIRPDKGAAKVYRVSEVFLNGGRIRMSSEKKYLVPKKDLNKAENLIKVFLS